MEIKLNNFIFTQSEKGDWLYKAVPFKPKVNDKERPQFTVVEDIENNYKEEFDRLLAHAVKDIARYLYV